MNLFQRIKHAYLQHQIRVLLPYLTGSKTVLDFGCGDMTFAEALRLRFPELRITGIDVVDEHRRVPGIPCVIYDGKKLPFPGGAFDTVIAYHVLHHTDDPRKHFSECMRVAKKQFLLVEPVMRSGLDRIGVRLTDQLCNAWRPEAIPMPYNFLSNDEWQTIFRKNAVTRMADKAAGVFPSFLPIGETRCFVLRK